MIHARRKDVERVLPLVWPTTKLDREDMALADLPDDLRAFYADGALDRSRQRNGRKPACGARGAVDVKRITCPVCSLFWGAAHGEFASLIPPHLENLRPKMRVFNGAVSIRLADGTEITGMTQARLGHVLSEFQRLQGAKFLQGFQVSGGAADIVNFSALVQQSAGRVQRRDLLTDDEIALFAQLDGRS